jgi:hypothetical protein
MGGSNPLAPYSAISIAGILRRNAAPGQLSRINQGWALELDNRHGLLAITGAEKK